VSVRMVKALTVKMETVPMNGKGAQNLTCFVYEVYEGNSKMFFLSRCFIFERSSCNQVNMVHLDSNAIQQGHLMATSE